VPPCDLIERTRLFALAVRDFCRKAPVSDEAQEAIKQLRKSANSVRSNYRAARKGRSRGEFESKLHIAFEEADECVDWLEYLRDTKLHHDAKVLQEAKEVAAILGAAVRTAKKNSARMKKVANVQRIFRVSPTRLVTRSRSRYSSSGMAYLRVMLYRSLNDPTSIDSATPFCFSA
jgi:four helix bundle protein